MGWIEAKFSNKEEWRKTFARISLETVKNNLRLLLTITGLCALMVCCLIGASIYFSLKIAAAYESIQSIIQVMNLVLMLLGFAIIYLGVYASRFQDFFKVEDSIPNWLHQGLIYGGIGLITISYIGFLAVYKESKPGL
jgi:hypothetical protein